MTSSDVKRLADAFALVTRADLDEPVTLENIALAAQARLAECG